MNYIYSLLLFVLVLFLTSCGWGWMWNSELERAKQELLWNIPAEETVTEEVSTETESAEDKEKETKNYIEIKDITENPIIHFSESTVQQFEDLEAEITGTIEGNVEKVTVLYANSEKDNTDETPYTLKKFQPGDTTFLFNAFKKYGTLDYGVNTYTITAFEWGKKHIIEMKVSLEQPKIQKNDRVDSSNHSAWTLDIHLQQTIVDSVNLDTLPMDEIYGNPVVLGNEAVTYSDIKGLEIKNVWDIELSTDPRSITDYLKEQYDGWFFWNTLRPIAGKKWVTFYVVLSPTGTGSYVYQKHYYDGSSLYWILPLGSGTLSQDQDLQSKNAELSQINNEFGIVAPTDALFSDILK